MHDSRICIVLFRQQKNLLFVWAAQLYLITAWSMIENLYIYIIILVCNHEVGQAESDECSPPVCQMLLVPLDFVVQTAGWKKDDISTACYNYKWKKANNYLICQELPNVDFVNNVHIVQLSDSRVMLRFDTGIIGEYAAPRFRRWWWIVILY